jgi:hypothetical protein
VECAKASIYTRPSAGNIRSHLAFDVDQLMASVVAPTLVLRSSDSAWSNEKETRRLVAGIPGAQMRIVSGTMVQSL